MDSPFLAGLNQFLYCTQATDADDSIVPECSAVGVILSD
jgi:hypothetical protein